MNSSKIKDSVITELKEDIDFLKNKLKEAKYEIKNRINSEALEFLSFTLKKMLDPMSMPEFFRFVSDQIYSISGGALISFSEFDNINHKVIVRELRCSQDERNKLIKILGNSPEGLEFSFPEEIRKRIISGGLDYLEGGFSMLVFNQLPEVKCKEIEKELNIKSIYAMACSVEDEILGTVAVISHDKNIREKKLVESIVNQAALVLKRKRIECILRESEEKFRSLFENITEGVALHELILEDSKPVNYRIIDANPAYTTHTGIDSKNAVGKLATEVYGTSDAPYLKEFARVAEQRKPYKFETFFDNMKKHFLIHVISPKEHQFATVFEDITEQKMIEKETKLKNEELTRFIYTVSHDLKSPLVTIKMFTSYLKEDIVRQDLASQETDLRYIENAADKMGRLLNELLELSRIGRKENAQTEITLHEVADEALLLVAGRIKEKGIQVIITSPPLLLYGHTQRFIQLFQNLIDNATKFMGKQSSPIIEIGSYINDSKEIVLFVKDNGTGIDPRYEHKIFGLFEKLDPQSEGTGIGLALVKRIVEVHGGSICYSSEGINKGTTFYFTLAKTRLKIN